MRMGSSFKPFVLLVLLCTIAALPAGADVPETTTSAGALRDCDTPEISMEKLEEEGADTAPQDAPPSAAWLENEDTHKRHWLKSTSS
jgi:hypothetical protein